MKNHQNKMIIISEYIVKAVIVFIVMCLLLLSVFSTSVLRGYEENTTYVNDNFLLHAVIVSVIMSALVMLARKGGLTANRILKKKTILILLLLIQGIIAVYWICSTQFVSMGDSAIIINIARQIEAGDFSAFMNLGYGERYANQFGIILFMNLMGKLTGFGSNLIFQLINASALLLLYYCICKISEEIVGTGSGLSTLVLIIAFFPLFLYIVFAYGNMISWALYAYAMYQEIMLIKTGRHRHGAGMALGIALSVQFKMFGILILIAMAIYGIYEGIREKRYRVIGYAALACMLTWLLNAGMVMYIDSHLEGYERQTLSPLGHVAMGMQESYMAPGWYNGIHDYTYLENNGDRDKTTAVFKEMIADRFEYFMKDPKYAAIFYGKKIASAWNNPSFQGFWFGEIGESAAEVPKWIVSVYEGHIRTVLDVYLNYLLTMIHAGVLSYFILGWKQIKMKQLFLAIAFLGGFLFLILWETKCQYTIGFFILLLPYCAEGYRNIYKLGVEKKGVQT